MDSTKFVSVQLPLGYGTDKTNRFNETAAPFRIESTIPELFEDTVKAYPDYEAVSFCDQSLNYEQLNQQANKIAHFIRPQLQGTGQIIAIITERSVEMIIGIYGILKSGAAYLPLPTGDPFNRVESLIRDACPVILLVQKKLFDHFSSMHTSVFCIEDILEKDLPVHNLPLINKPTDLAYVIFTSGSTGMPKGVMIEHRSLVNRLKWMQNAYPIRSSDVILQKTPYTFDVSVWEIFWWGLYGARVCMPVQNAEKNPISIVQAIVENQVTVLHFVPSMFNMFLEYVKMMKDPGLLNKIKWVFTSGEALQVSHVKKFNQTMGNNEYIRLINLYGPTEATVDVTHFDCSTGCWDNDIPIGKPIDNIQMHVLINDVEQTIGETGELCISGVGLARGYMNRIELTAERFTYPFGTTKERVYRTGDMACWKADGNLLYLGRQDSQVKIRGIRIELGEIEAILNEFPTVKHCMVDIKNPSENIIFLIAYYIADEELPEKEIKLYMKKYLPDYMIPNAFYRIEEMPVTAHGKLNKKALSKLQLK